MCQPQRLQGSRYSPTHHYESWVSVAHLLARELGGVKQGVQARSHGVRLAVDVAQRVQLVVEDGRDLCKWVRLRAAATTSERRLLVVHLPQKKRELAHIWPLARQKNMCFFVHNAGNRVLRVFFYVSSKVKAFKLQKSRAPRTTKGKN
jgi:hypothetical protein